uniref:PDZ domain-containing protein n=1 Tax=Romanomermis culicivorax TaxID=13658 RepID=A0A915ITD1_ROMCU
MDSIYATSSRMLGNVCLENSNFDIPSNISIQTCTVAKDDRSILTSTEKSSKYPNLRIDCQRVLVCGIILAKKWQFQLEDTVWKVKQTVLESLPKPASPPPFRLILRPNQSFTTKLNEWEKDVRERDGLNYGLFLPPCNGRAGKFLLEERPLKDYPFHDCVPYLEFKYKKRVYKMLNLDEKALRLLHNKNGLRKFLDYVENRNAEKIEKLCSQGFDPNFHAPNGDFCKKDKWYDTVLIQQTATAALLSNDRFNIISVIVLDAKMNCVIINKPDETKTPLTIASTTPNNAKVIIAVVAGGAHLDFRSLDGQTALHKAASLYNVENVKTLLSLGASPNCRDSLNLTPLYHCVLNPKSSAQTAEILLRDYSELGVEDLHGNQEIHQACKNGSNNHLEHLLFYGADLNHRNNNGNTPLHVCAVNNQETCARILMFRGADSSIVNNQGQTAYHVANFVGHSKVAEVIRAFSASQAVPYRSQPRYNSKRRFPLSKNDAADGYGTLLRHSSVGSYNSSSSSPYCDERRSTTADNGMGDSTCQQSNLVYGCSAKTNMNERRISVSNVGPFKGDPTTPNELNPAAVRSMKDSLQRPTHGNNESTPVAPESIYACQDRVCDDANIPRILVIPRGKKGFGFILRGAKKVDPTVNFQPTLEIPALQYFEGVDTNGMSMKAGLKPGDFLLEINNVDVRCASHEQVVRLIQMASDTITLKVITVDLRDRSSVPYFATMNRSTRSNAGHHCSNTYQQSSEHDQRLVHTLSHGFGRHLHRPPLGLGHYSNSTIGFNSGSTIQTLSNTIAASKSVESLPAAFRDPNTKVASIRNRSAHRRVSVTEVEQLMQRQCDAGAVVRGGVRASCSSLGVADDRQLYSRNNNENAAPQSRQGAPASPGPRVYASVAEMKRQKKQLPNAKPPLGYSNQNLDSQVSYQQNEDFYGDANEFNLSDAVSRNVSQFDPSGMRQRRRSRFDDHYGSDDTQVKKWSANSTSVLNDEPVVQRKISQAPPPPPPRDDASAFAASDYDNRQRAPSEPVRSAPRPPPPPPPPPPLDICRLSDGSTLKKALAQRRAAMTCAGVKNEESTTAKIYGKLQRGPADFQADLKSALAKRRSNLSTNKSIIEEKLPSNGDPSASKVEKSPFNPTIKGSATSLKESVANNILRKSLEQSKKTPPNYRPPSAISNASGNAIGGQQTSTLLKKDSGYTSSRNSLVEHNENAATTVSNDSSIHHHHHQNRQNVASPIDDRPSSTKVVFELNDEDSLNGDQEQNPRQFDMLKQSKVTVISQKIEENINGKHVASAYHLILLKNDDCEWDTDNIEYKVFDNLLFWLPLHLSLRIEGVIFKLTIISTA